MNNLPTNEPTGPLGESIKAMRGMVVPAGPSEELIAKTVARLGAGAKELDTHKEGWWTVKKVKATAWTAGLAAAMVAIVWVVWGLGNKNAFADVVQQVNAAHAVRFKITVETDASAGKQTQEMDGLMVQPSWFIESSQDVKFVMNAQQGKMLVLMVGLKQAMEVNYSDQGKPAMPRQALDMFDAFKKMGAQDGKPLGEKEIGGVKARGFEVKSEGSDIIVWADPGTDLPVVIEMIGGNPPVSPRQRAIFRDFDWNAKVQDGELSLEIPAGYTKGTMNIPAAATEDGVVQMLTMAVEIGDGKFPDELSADKLSQAMGKWMNDRELKETAGMTPAQKSQWQDKAMADVMKWAQPMALGVAYVGDATKGTDWTYGGKGAKRGEKDRPVLWYKPAGGKGWRVFGADLTVHDAAAAPSGGVPVKFVMQNNVPTSAATRAAPPSMAEIRKTVVAAAKEESLMPMLKAFAELNHGVYPNELSMGEYQRVAAAAMADRGAGPGGVNAQQLNDLTERVAKAGAEVGAIASPIGPGVGYMSDPVRGTEWTYAGKGVKPDEKDMPILWYRTAGGVWRVVDADGALHDAKEKPAGGGKVTINIENYMPDPRTTPPPPPTRMP